MINKSIAIIIELYIDLRILSRYNYRNTVIELQKSEDNRSMANSKYEYVRQFETHDVLLPETYIVVRIDGKKFHEFSKYYDFAKPNDERALKLMNACAKNVV